MVNTALMNLAIQLEESRVNAMVHKDIHTLTALFTEDLYYGHTGGYVDDKAAILEKLSSGLYSYASIQTKIDDVMAIGESGLVINGELTIEANVSGETKIFHAIYLAVWRQEAETWRFLSLQAAYKK